MVHSFLDNDKKVDAQTAPVTRVRPSLHSVLGGAGPGLKGTDGREHGRIFLAPVFADQINGGACCEGQLLRGQKFNARQDAQDC